MWSCRVFVSRTILFTMALTRDGPIWKTNVYTINRTTLFRMALTRDGQYGKKRLQDKIVTNNITAPGKQFHKW